MSVRSAVRARTVLPAVAVMGALVWVVVQHIAPAAAAPEDVVASAAAEPDSGAAEAAGEQAASTGTPVVRYFYGDGCPFCAQQAVEMDAWEAELDVEIHRYEVWNDAGNRELYAELAAAYGVEPSGVPATFIGPWVWLGFNADLAADMRGALAACATDGCDDPLTALEPDPAPEVGGDPAAAPGAASTTIRVPFVGSVDLAGGGVIASTALIAFVDGFNPCSLWVLSVLLALLVRGGSRGRLALVGTLFLGVTALIYGLFIAGIFGTMSYVGHLGWIRGVVAAFALTFAAVNIKDYLRLKQGLSFTIPDRAKPRIYRGGRKVALGDDALPVVLGATVVMAAGVALVELPCTAGFPVVWSSIVSDAGVAGAGFVGLLSLYIGIYLLDELVLLTVVVVTMSVSKVQERHVQGLKLVGGTVMLALGVVILVAPEIMHGLGGTLAVFLIAVLLAAAIHAARRLATR